LFELNLKSCNKAYSSKNLAITTRSHVSCGGKTAVPLQ